METACPPGEHLRVLATATPQPSPCSDAELAGLVRGAASGDDSHGPD
jgi:hypothetical protein